MRILLTSETMKESYFAYILGRQPSDGVMLIDEQEELTQITICLDGRYIEQDLTVPTEELEARTGTPVHIEKVLRTESVVDTLQALLTGSEDELIVSCHVPYHLGKKLQESFPELSFESDRSLQQRAVKTEREQARIRDATTITHEVFQWFVGEAETFLGMSERAVRAALLRKAVALGAEREAFPAIVATGAHSAVPHHQSGDAILTPGPLLIDMGYRLDGYCSDFTATTWIEGKGEEAVADKDEFIRVYEIVHAAHDAARDKVAPGVSASEIDAAAREIISNHGYGDQFVHSTGHGIGLDIHELPRISSSSDEVLEEGMVITIEPGIYLPGKFGVRWENAVVV